MQRTSKQLAGTLYNRRVPPRMMQPTCWEKACGSATQRFGISNNRANYCTAIEAAKNGMICVW